MSALRELLTEFTRRGIRMRLVGAAVKLSPKSALDAKLLARAVKTEIVCMLSSRPESCSKECYEVERGRRVHRPWARCTTTRTSAVTETPGRTAELVCWHCLGTKRCSCLSHDSDVCGVSKGAGSVQGWIQ